MTTKDPDARLDYAWDWTGWLGDTDTIVSFSVFVASGDIDEDGSDEDSGIVTVWFKDGTTRSTATCGILTSEGRIDQRTRTITIKQR